MKTGTTPALAGMLTGLERAGRIRLPTSTASNSNTPPELYQQTLHFNTNNMGVKLSVSAEQ